MSTKPDPVHLIPAAPPDSTPSAPPLTPGRLNLGATSLLGSSPVPDSFRDTAAPMSIHQASTLAPKLPRVDFPKFNGSNVRSWLQKTQRFFILHPMDEQQKVLYASLYFSDAVDTWFQTDPLKFTSLGWKEFSLLVQQRFSEELTENVIGEFKLLS
ncbi:hypothetical protein ACHQM5_026117 [Ranunculus cassubicifolius]